jgi:localization factor PodJL
VLQATPNVAEQGRPANVARQSTLELPPATVGPLSLRMAAASGDPSAQFEVGARLAEGKGTTQNFKEAQLWYQRAASQGLAQAQYRLGTLFERGLGAKADAGRARMWYQRAAEQGNVKAMHNLAVLSASRDAASPDYATASQWFGKAAEYGLADSQFNLAVLHENGLGATKDSKLAYKWYALAAQSGDKEAAKRRDAMKTQLSPDDLFAAEDLVETFSPKRIEPMANDARVAGEDWKKREAGDNG